MAKSIDRRAVSDPGQIRLLRSPVRQEIVDTLAALGGEASVGALAEQLGRPADGLYYHLRALTKGGLVTEVAGPDGGERLYRLAGDGNEPLRLAYASGPQGNLSELSPFARGLFKIAIRDFEDALGTEGVVVDGRRRELWVSRNKGWLSPEELEEVNALLERLSTLTSQPKARGRTRLMSFAFVLSPVNPRPKRRVSGG